MAATQSASGSVAVPGSSSGSTLLKEADPPIQPRPLKALATLLAKRSFDLFASNHGQRIPIDEAGCVLRPVCCCLAAVLQAGLDRFCVCEQAASKDSLQGAPPLALVATDVVAALRLLTCRCGTSTTPPTRCTRHNRPSSRQGGQHWVARLQL